MSLRCTRSPEKLRTVSLWSLTERLPLLRKVDSSRKKLFTLKLPLRTRTVTKLKSPSPKTTESERELPSKDSPSLSLPSRKTDPLPLVMLLKSLKVLQEFSSLEDLLLRNSVYLFSLDS